MRALAVIVVTASRVATANPALDHVVTAPTAWLPGAGTLAATAGLDHHGDAMIDLGAGLGRIAEVDLGRDTDERACTACSHDEPAPQVALVRAGFRLGAPADAWFAHQPALVFGVRATVGDGRRVGEAYAVASARLGIIALHAGAIALDAIEHGPRLGTQVRPFGGAELTPPQYPKTTLMVDVAWHVRFEPEAPRLEYAASWGVRYQALTWGSIELDVGHREAELGSPTVMVHLTGVWERRPGS